MFIVSLTYRVPLAEIDAHLADHRAFLDRPFASGAFLASGPKVPRTGGVILATLADRTRLDAILAEDPFHRLGMADYVIEAFTPSRFADALPEAFRERLRAGG